MTEVTLHRGKTQARPGAVSFMLRDYLNETRLPDVPHVFGHVHASPVQGWGMFGNELAGDCVCAGAEHESMVWAMATKRTVPNYDDRVSLKNYSDMMVDAGGAPYNPHDPSTDTGLDMQRAAAYRQKTGVLDLAGNRHFIKAYAAVSIDDAPLAAYLFGVCGVGLALPDSAEQQFIRYHIWDDVTSTPQPQNGHYVPIVGRNSLGNFMVITWSRLHAMTPEYFARYYDEAVAYFSMEYLVATGKSPEAIDEAALEADLAAL
jgi:hypothetical protein